MTKFRLNVSKKYGVAQKTICFIKNKRLKIIELVRNDLVTTKKRTIRSADFPKKERRLLKWFLRKSVKNFFMLPQQMNINVKFSARLVANKTDIVYGF